MNVFKKKRTIVVLEGSLIELLKLVDRFGKQCEKVTYVGSDWRQDNWIIQLNLSKKDWDIFKDMLLTGHFSKNISYEC